MVENLLKPAADAAHEAFTAELRADVERLVALGVLPEGVAVEEAGELLQNEYDEYVERYMKHWLKYGFGPSPSTASIYGVDEIEAIK